MSFFNEPIEQGENYFLDYKGKYFNKVRTLKLKRMKEIAKENPALAMYLLDIYENDIAEEWIQEYFEPNINMYHEKIREKSPEAPLYLQAALMALKYVGKERLEQVAEDIFKKCAEDELDYTEEQRMRYWANRISNTFLTLPKDYRWKEHYICILQAIWKAYDYNPKFIDLLEQKLSINLVRICDKDSVRNYISLLKENGAYDAIKLFLDKIWDEKSSIVDCNDEEIYTDAEIEELLCKNHSSPRMVGFYLEYFLTKGLDEETLYEKIEGNNQDEEVLKWLDLERYYRELRKLLEQAKNTEDESIRNEKWSIFNEKIKLAKEKELFDMSQNTYMTRMAANYAYILDELLLNDNEDIVTIFESLEKINLFSYDKRKYTVGYILYSSVYNPYVIAEKVKGKHKKKKQKNSEANRELYRRLLEHLLKIKNVEDMVNIYMNSHLRFIIDFRDLLDGFHGKEFNGRAYAATDMKKLFKEYPFEGTVFEYKKHERDANSIHFRTTCVNFASKKSTWFITNQDWYDRNKSQAQLLNEEGNLCSYSIVKHEGDTIYVEDVAFRSEEQEQNAKERREQFEENALEWLAKMQELGKFLPWDEKEMDELGNVVSVKERGQVYGVMFLPSAEKRREIALNIIRTIISLSEKPEELNTFLYEIQNPPLEEINEFRYIATQKWCDPDFEKDCEFEYKKKICDYANTILKSKKLDEKTKSVIYHNTCIKKFYYFEYMYNRLHDQVLWQNDVSRLVVPVLYRNGKFIIDFFIKDKKTYEIRYVGVYKMQRENVRKGIEPIDIRYCGEEKELKNYWIYHAFIQWDTKENCIIITDLFDADNDAEKEKMQAWDVHIRMLYDIKKLSTDELVGKKKNKDAKKGAFEESVKHLGVKYDSLEKVMVFTDELILAFQRFNFNPRYCKKILDILGTQTPYKANEEESYLNLLEYKELFREKYYQSTYRNMFLSEIKNEIEKQKSSGYGIVRNVYLNSFLKYVLSEEELIKDMLWAGMPIDAIEGFYEDDDYEIFQKYQETFLE